MFAGCGEGTFVIGLRLTIQIRHARRTDRRQLSNNCAMGSGIIMFELGVIKGVVLERLVRRIFFLHRFSVG
jgi:hypothetical protein